MNQQQPEQETPTRQDKQKTVIDLSKKARHKLRGRRYREAIELFQRGLDLEPENPYLLSGMGDACRESGDYKEGRRCYQLLLDIDPINLFALRGLGDVYKKLDRHQEAIEVWERYLCKRPDDKHVMTRIADSCKALQLYERAEDCYKRILVIDARDRFALTGLADLQHRQGKDVEAIKTYERVLRFDENELHILTIIGKLCWRVSDFKSSERYFLRALAIDPDNPYALYGLGNCYRWGRNYEGALAKWNQILEKSEGTQALHTRMGDAFFHSNMLEDAEKSYLKALSFGEDIYSTAGLVCLYAERHQWVRSVQYFTLLVSAADDVQNRLDMLIKRFEFHDQKQTMSELFQHLLSEASLSEGVSQRLNSLL